MEYLKTNGHRAVALLVTLLLFAVAPVVSANKADLQQDGATATKQQNNPSTSKKQPAKQAWRVQVSQGMPILLSVWAQDAPMADIAADISRQLKVPVLLSPLVKALRVTTKFENLSLEAALHQFAPQGYVDYELRANDSKTPKKLVKIYLNAINEVASTEIDQSEESQPKTFDEVAKMKKPRPQFLVIQGDTEASTTNPTLEINSQNSEKGNGQDSDALKVTYENNRLTVHARQQSLPAVIYAIAQKLSVPAEVSNFDDSLKEPELVNVDFYGYTVEEAVRSLSPAIRLHMRTDLETSETKPIRLVLALMPEKTAGKVSSAN